MLKTVQHKEDSSNVASGKVRIVKQQKLEILLKTVQLKEDSSNVASGKVRIVKQLKLEIVRFL